MPQVKSRITSWSKTLITKTDGATGARLLDVRDPLRAVMLLSRLPLGRFAAKMDFTRSAASAWAWPLVGALLGGLGALFATGLLWLGLTDSTAAILVLGLMVVMTGALHEDGLADTADGFWGGPTAARRLEIMKDSHIGSYGTLALGLSLMARYGALVVLFQAGLVWMPLIAAGLLSRAPLAVLMARLNNARGSGLSDQIGRPSITTARIGAGLALVLAVLCMGSWGLIAGVTAALAAFACAKLAMAKVNGQTGDVLGATQQICDITVLMTFVALL